MTAAAQRTLRTCLGCRQVLEKNNLLRYVVSPQGDLLVDYQGKLPGRGAYTCFSPECLRKAVKRGQFGRSFRRDLRPGDPADLIEDLRRQIEDRIASLIGMTRKAGALVVGSSQVLDSVIRKDSLSCVLRTEDVSEGIAAKVEGRVRKMGIKLYTKFSKAELGEMLGRDEVSVVGFRTGALAESLELEFQRYQQIAEGL